MASSAAHLDPKKNGLTICEAFGAYGWTEGLKTMKWITDVMCVRGINMIIPHAFSPAPFPHEDCPPHFYANGKNPQFRYFSIWANYTNRVCSLLSDGDHSAPVAVLYHAEAEWGGDCEPFEDVVKILMKNQIDCDIIPADILYREDKCFVLDGKIHVNNESFSSLIVPYSENLPANLMQRINSFADSELKIFFINNYPRRCYFGVQYVLNKNMCKINYAEISDILKSIGCYDILCNEEKLVYYHYIKDGRDLYFFSNEDIHNHVDTVVKFRQKNKAYLYDALNDKKYNANQNITEDGSEIRILLSPYQSIFVVFEDFETHTEITDIDQMKAYELSCKVKIEISSYDEYPKFTETAFSSFANMAKHDILPEFSGTFRYTMTFDFHESFEKALLDLGCIYEIADVFLNGYSLGIKICPPYLFEISKEIIKEKDNILIVEVTNTLAKKFGKNIFDRYWQQEPSGMLDCPRIFIK
jgi:hypothetical protein